MRRNAFLFGGLLVGALGVAAGCALHEEEEVGTVEPAIRELERRALGKPQPYPADRYTEEDEKLFARSMKARRELGWKVLAKVLQPVEIAAQSADAGAAKRTVPLFRTWLGGDEFERMFTKMYGDFGKTRRARRDTPTERELDALFDWNTTSLGPNTEQEYFDRIELIANQQQVDGLGGNARASYSPAYVRHLMKDYAAASKCKLDAIKLDTAPTSEANFTNCFSSELPADAAVIKASWRRNDELVDTGLPAHDHSAATLAKRVAGTLDNGGWPRKNVPLVKATPEEAYTVRLQGNEGYSLVGLHVITKELRHWVWVSMWWAPNGDEDFGQDRPASIRSLGGPWGHYKMCVVTDFDELDSDPRGGFTGSLGDSLAAVHGPQTWCSNAFVEKGDHNAQTNCIGCHQHAGDIGQPLEALINDETKYPVQGRKKVREGFPADYSWAFATPPSPDDKDRFQKVIVDRISLYDGAER